MPLRMDLLKASGIAGTVAERVAAHPNRVVREAAARLQARWSGRPAAPVQAAVAVPVQAPAQNGGSGGRPPAAAEADTGSEEEAAEMMDPDLLAKLAAAQQVTAAPPPVLQLLKHALLFNMYQNEELTRA